MRYSTVKSRLIDVNINRQNHLSLNNVLQMLKNKKQAFEWFLLNFQTMNDETFLLWYKKFFAIHMEALKDKYYTEKFDWPVSSLVKVDDFVRCTDADDVARYYNCEYAVVHDINFDLEDRVYSREELVELQNQGKVIIEQTKLRYGKSLEKDELKNRKFGILVEPFALSDEYVAKSIREEMTKYELKLVNAQFAKCYAKYLSLIKQKIKDKVAEK